MEDVRSKLHAYIYDEKRQASLIEFCDWIKEGSLPGEEESIQRKICAKLAGLGFTTDLYFMGTEDDGLLKDPYFVKYYS